MESAIREHFAPVLREDGFAGSGRTFRRVVGGWIHVVSVQGSRYGGEFAVNLALQPTTIPDALGKTPDLKKITEDICEFRRRLSDSVARQDMWWKHDSTEQGMAAAVCEAAGTYRRTGRALLNDATAESSELNTLAPSTFAAGAFNFQGFGSTESRMAFALARLRRVHGLEADAHAFAIHALSQAGNASALKAQIRAFMEQA